MALGDSRRASGADIERARRQLGLNNETARRNLGRQMEAARRGVDVVEDIARLTPPTRPTRTLSRVPAVGGYTSQRGRADYNPPRSMGGGGGGIAGPLTEKDGSRTYHPRGFIYSNDFLLALEIRPLASMTMVDANSAEIVFNYDGTP